MKEPGQSLFRTMTVLTSVTLAQPGCAVPAPSWEQIAARTPAAEVTAAGETEVVATANADAADDPAIWQHPHDPAKSLIIGTDKKAGLNVYDLRGFQRDFAAAGRVNNVDLIESRIGTRRAVLVAASDRNDPLNAKIALFELDPEAPKLKPLGSVAAGSGEAYGICLAPAGDEVDAFMVTKSGSIAQVALDLSGAAPSGRLVRTMKLATQSEGCVVDPRTQRLYVAEENVGIWRFDARRDGPTTATALAKVDGKRLVADVEGVALAPFGADAGWLIVSSQGDNAYTLYRLKDGGYAGRFRIAPGHLGATSETDGIALVLGDFGPYYPGGLFVAQDGDNSPDAQNFKLVAWDDVVKAIHLYD